MTTLASCFMRGLRAAVPTDGIAGSIYFATDTGQILYSDGTTWWDVSPDLSAASVNDIQQSTLIYVVDTGLANAYVVAFTTAPTLVAGSQILMKAANDNTGPSTVTVNGGSAIPIKKQGLVALAGGEIFHGQMVRLTYDGTNFQI